MHNQFLTPEEVRAMIERTEARNAELRAKYPHSAHIFPPITDEIFRYVMERALLGELRHTPLLPPIKNSPGGFPGDEHEQNAQSAPPASMIP
jgi:hypothetical protein